MLPSLSQQLGSFLVAVNHSGQSYVFSGRHSVLVTAEKQSGPRPRAETGPSQGQTDRREDRGDTEKRQKYHRAVAVEQSLQTRWRDCGDLGQSLSPDISSETVRDSESLAQSER